MLHRLLTLYARSGSNPFSPNSIAGLEQLLFTTQLSTLAGVVADERTGLGTDRARQPGRAYDFDGVDDYNVLPSAVADLAAADTDFSLILTYISDTTDNTTLFSTGKTSSRVTITTVRCGVHDGTTHAGKSTISVVAGTVYHLVMTYDTDTHTVKAWRNGVELTGTLTPTPGSTTKSAAIGALNTGGVPFDGKIANVMIVGSTLSDTDALAASSTGLYTGATTGHWKCDEGAETTAYDSSGNENHGTITNATLSTFHATDADAPYSFQNEVGYSDRQNYVKQSHNLSDSAWSKSGVTVAESAEFWVLTRTNVAPGAAVQTNIIPDTDDYVISLTLRAGSSSRISIGLFDGGWNSVDYEIVSGSGSVSGVGTLITISGLDSNDTVLKLQYKPGAALADLYIYPDSSVGSGVAGSTNLVKDIQVYKGTLATTQPGIAETGVNQVLGLQPRDESAPTLDVLGNALDYTGKAPNPGQATGSACGTFDGVDDYISFTSDVVLDGDFEISCYFSLTSLSDEPVFGNDGATLNGFLFPNASAVRVYIGGSFVSFSVSITTGVLYNFKVTRSGTDVRFFIDDVESASGALTLAGTMTLNTIGRANTFYGKRLYCNAKIYKDGDLVLHYPLSENSGATAHDVSGNDNHGTITNATTTTGAGFWANTQDVFHWSLAKGFDRVGTFDGVDDEIIANDVTISAGMTVCFWVYSNFTSTAVSRGLVCSRTDTNNNFRILYTSGNVFTGWEISGTTYGGLTSLPTDNAWVHVVVESDGVGLQKVYYDNVSKSVTAGLPGRHDTDGQLVIGCRGTNFLDGRMSDVRVYGKALSADERLYVYTLGVSGTDPGVGSLLSHYPLSENSGATAYDVSGNGNHGTLSGDDGSSFWGTEVPANTDGTSIIGGSSPSNPARVGHNGGITDLTLADGSWSFNDARSNPAFKRTLTESAVAVAADRFVTFSATLSGSDLTNMQTYTATTEI